MIFYGPAKSLLSLFLPFVEDFTVDKMIIDTKTRPPFYHTTSTRHVGTYTPRKRASYHLFMLNVSMSECRVCKHIMAVMTENASASCLPACPHGPALLRPLFWQPSWNNLEIIDIQSTFQEQAMQRNMNKLVLRGNIFK